MQELNKQSTKEVKPTVKVPSANIIQTQIANEDIIAVSFDQAIKVGKTQIADEDIIAVSFDRAIKVGKTQNTFWQAQANSVEFKVVGNFIIIRSSFSGCKCATPLSNIIYIELPSLDKK